MHHQSEISLQTALAQSIDAEPTQASENDSDCLLARLHAFKRIYVEHAQVKSVETDLENLFKYGKVGTENGSAFCYLLTGEPGWGKSTLLRNFANRHKPQFLPAQTIRPVLYVELKGTAKRKEVAEKLLNALGAPYSPNASERALTQLALLHLRSQKVQVVVLDEAQTFVDQETLKFGYASAEWLKGLLNAGVCAFVFAGMPAARAIYDLDEQFQRRSFGSRELVAFDRKKEVEMEDFSDIVQHLVGNSPLPHTLGVCDEGLVLAFFAVARGRVGMLVDFIVKASVFAAEDGRKKLTVENLAEAAARLKPLADPKWQNPFLLTPDELSAELDRIDLLRGIGGLRLNLRRGKRKPRMSDVFVQ